MAIDRPSSSANHFPIWNANGLSKYRNVIILFIKNNNIDILLISEIHFTRKIYIVIKGYDIINAYQPSGQAQGGSAVIVKNTLIYKTLHSISTNLTQVAKIQIKCMHSNIAVAAVYVPPRYPCKLDNFNTLFQGLGRQFIAGGDYNAKHPWWGSRLEL